MDDDDFEIIGAGPLIEAALAPPVPTGRIAPQPWMTDAATRRVMAALAADGVEPRFVGGCVRDAVSGRPVHDVDIATPDPPERVTALLERAGVRVVPTGIAHGTVTAVLGERRFEITTLRRDVETDGRRARVAFTDDWLIDARRRDFTINTLSCTVEGDVYDPCGGLADLGGGIVRFVGSAGERIEEDVLRLLRFFRFFATFGRPPADADALAACRIMAPKIPTLSGERVRDEFLRILLAPNCADTMVLMRGERVLEWIVPEPVDTGRLRMTAWLETTAIRRDPVAPDPLRRLAALMGADAAAIAALARRLRLSNRDSDRLAALTAAPALTPESGRSGLDRALYDAGAALARDRVLLSWAGEMASDPRHTSARTAQWIAMLDAVDSWTRPEFPLDGHDVAALGVPAGPAVGELLERVEAWWLEGGFAADRAACLDRLRAITASRP